MTFRLKHIIYLPILSFNQPLTLIKILFDQRGEGGWSGPLVKPKWQSGQCKKEAKLEQKVSQFDSNFVAFIETYLMLQF